MKEFLDTMLTFWTDVSDFMWGEWMIFLLALTGIIMTVATKGIQFRKMIFSLKYRLSLLQEY